MPVGVNDVSCVRACVRACIARVRARWIGVDEWMGAWMDGWRGLVVRKVICFVMLSQLHLKNALPKESWPQWWETVPVVVIRVVRLVRKKKKGMTE